MANKNIIGLTILRQYFSRVILERSGKVLISVTLTGDTRTFTDFDSGVICLIFFTKPILMLLVTKEVDYFLSGRRVGNIEANAPKRGDVPASVGEMKMPPVQSGAT